MRVESENLFGRCWEEMSNPVRAEVVAVDKKNQEFAIGLNPSQITNLGIRIEDCVNPLLRLAEISGSNFQNHETYGDVLVRSNNDSLRVKVFNTSEYFSKRNGIKVSWGVYRMLNLRKGMEVRLFKA